MGKVSRSIAGSMLQRDGNEADADAEGKYKYDFQLLFHYFAKEFVLLRVRHIRQRHLARMSPYLSTPPPPPCPTLCPSLCQCVCVCVYCNVQNIGRCRRTSKSYESPAATAGTWPARSVRGGATVAGASGSGWRVYTCRDKDKTCQSTRSQGS